MELTDILTTYWSQATLVLFGICYFIKRVFDIKSKKLEINHSLFQQNKLNTVNRFCANYARAELMWNQLAIYDIISHKLDAKEIDKIIFPILNELDATILELKIYFKDSDHKYFSDIKKNLLLIHGKLSHLRSSLSENISEIEKASKYELIKIQVYRDNKKLLAEISKFIRLSFKS